MAAASEASAPAAESGRSRAVTHITPRHTLLQTVYKKNRYAKIARITWIGVILVFNIFPVYVLVIVEQRLSVIVFLILTPQSGNRVSTSLGNSGLC